MGKINLLYDATIVCSILTKNASRSGIFFVAYNVLLEFLKRDELDVWLYSDDLGKLREVINNYPEFKHCKVYRFSFIDNLLEIFSQNKLRYKKNFLLKLLNSIMYKFVKLFEIRNLSGIDVYFSPMKAVPKFVAKNKSIRKFTILHDTIPLVNDYRENVGHKWFYKLVKSINKDDYYFANSEYTKQDFIKYVPNINPENITVIPLSTGKCYEKIDDIDIINSVKKKYNIPLDKKYIFSLCNLDPRKNLIFSVQNFLSFIKKNNLEDFVFVLGGAYFPDFIEKLTLEINNLEEKENKILCIGYVDDEDMSALYSGAEMFLFPSLYEGFGMPVLEAMQCGLPVICSNVTSIPEVIEDCGIQIDPKSDNQMVLAMEKMYFDRSFRSQCVKKGLERSKFFTWKKCVDVIISKMME